MSPGADATLKGARPTLPLHIGGFEELNKEGNFSPGRVSPYPFAPQVYHVSSFPIRGVARVRVEAGVAGSVLLPEQLQSEYKLTVYYRTDVEDS